MEILRCLLLLEDGCYGHVYMHDTHVILDVYESQLEQIIPLKRQNDRDLKPPTDQIL